MIYQAGKMGAAEGLAMVFVVTFVPAFMTTPALRSNAVDTLAWFSILISGLASAVMFSMLYYVLTQVKGDLYDVCQALLGKIGATLVYVYLSTAFFANYIAILRQFAENTLLTALPQVDFTVIISLYAGAAAILVYMGIEGINRAAYLMLPFAVTALLVVLLLLIPFYHTYNLYPLQGTGLFEAVWDGVSLAGFHLGLLGLPILASSFQNRRTMKQAFVYGFGLSVLLRAFSVLVYLLTFGVPVVKEKILPFFEMARLVYLSRYIQRLEALFILLWVIIGIFAAALSLYFGLYALARVSRQPALRPVILPLSILLAMLSMLPPDVTQVILLQARLTQTYFNIGAYVLPVVLLLALMVKKRKGAAQCRNA